MVGGKILNPGLNMPPIELGEYQVPFGELAFDQAFSELEFRADDESNHTWGYFPAYAQSEDYPQASALAGSIETHVLSEGSLRSQDFKLAFIRVATAEPDARFGGLHVDVDIGVGHQRDPETYGENQEIIRLLFNASRKVPRRLEWAETTRDQLNNRGVNVSGDRYEALELSKDIPIHAADIPPRTDHSIFGLRFLSSQIPHRGVTDGRGHFLIAYGAYVDDVP